MDVQTKFKVTQVTTFEASFGGEGQLAKRVQLAAVKGEPFGPQTPQGTIEMIIVNMDAANKFHVGKEYFVTFSDGSA